MTNKTTPKKRRPAEKKASSTVSPFDLGRQEAPKSKKSCFIIMPIGDQKFLNITIAASDLKARYTDLIKEALERVRTDLEIIRADEVAAGGGISNDIFTRLMSADYVVADVSYPNPNVYYELGIRHACRPGTITIRDKSSPYHAPFDVSTLRHIEYENTPSGLKGLSENLRHRLAWSDNNPTTPDNQFLELAQFTEYQFQHYGKRRQENTEAIIDAMGEMFKYPELIALFTSGEVPDQSAILALATKYPDAIKIILRVMVRTGQIKLPGM